MFKIHHDLNNIQAEAWNWYIGLYLGMPRVFMTVVRKKLVYCPAVESVLIPLHTVYDPVTGRKITINITDRYFFIGTNTPIRCEDDLGIQGNANSIMLVRNNPEATQPSQITAAELRTVIRSHLQKHRTTIQQDVTVQVLGGAFNGWYGVVENTSEDLETVRVRFTCDDYHYTTELPSALCKIAS